MSKLPTIHCNTYDKKKLCSHAKIIIVTRTVYGCFYFFNLAQHKTKYVTVVVGFTSTCTYIIYVINVTIKYYNLENDVKQQSINQ